MNNITSASKPVTAGVEQGQTPRPEATTTARSCMGHQGQLCPSVREGERCQQLPRRSGSHRFKHWSAPA